MAPDVVDQRILYRGTGHKHQAYGLVLDFSTALSPSSAEDRGDYMVTQVGPRRHSRPKVITVRSAQYDPWASSVQITLGRFQAKKQH